MNEKLTMVYLNRASRDKGLKYDGCISTFFACKEKFKRKRKNLIFYGFGQVFPDMPKFGQKSRMDCLVGCLVDIRMNKSL